MMPRRRARMTPAQRARAREQWYWVRATLKAVHVGVSRREHLWERTIVLVHGPGSTDLTIPPEVKRKVDGSDTTSTLQQTPPDPTSSCQNHV